MAEVDLKCEQRADCKPKLAEVKDLDVFFTDDSFSQTDIAPANHGSLLPNVCVGSLYYCVLVYCLSDYSITFSMGSHL